MSKVITQSFLIILLMNVKAIGSHVIPFELVGNLIIISAIVDGKEGNYIVDTGVPIVYLNENYFAGKMSDKVMYGINGEGSEVSTRYSEIEIAGSVWKSVYAEIINLESIEQALGKSVHGLLGCRLFRRHMIEFDYAKMEMTISLPDKDAATSGHREEVSTKIILFKFRGRIPVIDARLGSLDLSLIVDTGSATNILGEESLKNLTANSIKWDKQRLTGFGKTEIKADAG
ncbi:MAG: hypothetical protein HKN76_09110, partial [Saprospiraceae bacterium]|nr:hypothetical protein [Saprospiraceae bacterium]